MNSSADVIVQAADFSVEEENRRLLKGHADGALVNFIGLVRQNKSGTLLSMELEHYPGMTEASIHGVIEQARQRWRLQAIRVIHRVGVLKPGEQIVYVGVAAAHRQAAFDGCSFTMDFLKTQAPFWKKETFESGAQEWVASRQTDIQATKKWTSQTSDSEN